MKNFRIGIAVSLIVGLLNFVAYVPQANAAAADTDSALTLNGTSQYSITSNVAGANLVNAFTVEAWLYRSSACTDSTYCHYVAKENAYLFGTYAGYLHYALMGAGGSWGYVNTGYYVPFNEWVHITFTRNLNSNLLQIYINGQPFRTDMDTNGLGTGDFYSLSTYSLMIGARTEGAPAYYWGGMIDEVKIWSVARTQSQVISDMNSYGPINGTGLLAYYDFNDGSASTNKTTNATKMGNLTAVGSANISVADSSTVSAGKTYRIFPKSYITSSGGYKIPANVSTVQALLVAGGGGGGGYAWAGGGGAGGVVYDSDYAVTSGSFLPIAVGGGGFEGPDYATASNLNRAGNGADSWIGNSSFAAIGGGAGAGYVTNLGDAYATGSAGGSSGGNSEHTSGLVLTSPSILQTTPSGATSSFGYVGGSIGAYPGTYQSGSGGGGAGSVGSDGTIYTGGNGGDGIYNAITDDARIGKYSNSHYYIAGGGGGSGISTNGTGSAGGGTAGNVQSTLMGLPLSGGGGGGGRYSWGGHGGSGVVVLVYVNYFSASVTISVGAKKSTKVLAGNQITANTTSTGTVTFYANGRLINGCKNVAVSGTTATCNWKPLTQGQVTLTATYTSNDVAYAGSASAPAFVTTVGKRTSAR